MILYLFIITICVVLLSVINCVWGLGYLGLDTFQTIGLIILCVIISIALDGICAFLTRKLENKISPFSKFFNERKDERKFYDKLKIKKWKDKIPELGKTLHYFDKTTVEEDANSDYFLKFIKETCVGEIIHVTSLPAALLLIVIFGFNYLTITIPITIVNIIMQLPSICVLRYTRTKLFVAYKLKLRHENKNLK